jgi:hypothetical protein
METSKQYARIEKTVIFFIGGRVGCRQNPSLYKPKCQSTDGGAKYTTGNLGRGPSMNQAGNKIVQNET